MQEGSWVQSFRTLCEKKFRRTLRRHDCFYFYRLTVRDSLAVATRELTGNVSATSAIRTSRDQVIITLDRMFVSVELKPHGT